MEMSCGGQDNNAHKESEGDYVPVKAQAVKDLVDHFKEISALIIKSTIKAFKLLQQ